MITYGSAIRDLKSDSSETHEAEAGSVASCPPQLLTLEPPVTSLDCVVLPLLAVEGPTKSSKMVSQLPWDGTLMPIPTAPIILPLPLEMRAGS